MLGAPSKACRCTHVAQNHIVEGSRMTTGCLDKTMAKIPRILKPCDSDSTFYNFKILFIDNSKTGISDPGSQGLLGSKVLKFSDLSLCCWKNASQNIPRAGSWLSPFLGPQPGPEPRYICSSLWLRECKFILRFHHKALTLSACFSHQNKY